MLHPIGTILTTKTVPEHNIAHYQADSKNRGVRYRTPLYEFGHQDGQLEVQHQVKIP